LRSFVESSTGHRTSLFGHAIWRASPKPSYRLHGNPGVRASALLSGRAVTVGLVPVFDPAGRPDVVAAATTAGARSTAASSNGVLLSWTAAAAAMSGSAQARPGPRRRLRPLRRLGERRCRRVGLRILAVALASPLFHPGIGPCLPAAAGS
jgi:hypothetical protein